MLRAGTACLVTLLAGAVAEVRVWLARVSGVLTTGLLSPVNFLFVAPAMIWVAGVSWVLGREGAHGGQTARSSGAV